MKNLIIFCIRTTKPDLSIRAKINKILSDYGDLIIARTGIPYQQKKCCVITLVVDATTNEIGILTGKLGMIRGVTVKSAMCKGV